MKTKKNFHREIPDLFTTAVTLNFSLECRSH